MAAAGYRVHCFDLSAIGLTRFEQQADESGYTKNIKTHQIDVHDIEFPVTVHGFGTGGALGSVSL